MQVDSSTGAGGAARVELPVVACAEMPGLDTEVFERVELRTDGRASFRAAGLAGPARGADVLHLPAGEIDGLPALRRLLPQAALVLDLRGSGPLGRRDARRAQEADALVVGHASELRALGRLEPRLAGRAEVVPLPVPLDEYVGLEALRATRDADVKRFRRVHRLAAPVVLFAGPYDDRGGAEAVLEAVRRLREDRKGLRFAAVPEGRVDRRVLDRLERSALALGHHGIVEWSPDALDLPLWYGLAAVVCLPAVSAVSPRPAQLAAAAGRPFVGSTVDSLAGVVTDGETGRLVPAGDGDALVAALAALLDDEEQAKRLGAAARSRAEAEWSPAAVGRGLEGVWLRALERRRAVGA